MTSVRDQGVGDYLRALASTAAVPGGGSAAALSAAMGAALLSMVAKLSARKARSAEARSALEAVVPELDRLTDQLLTLSQDDVDAYRAVIEARKSGGDDGSLARSNVRAAEVPLATASAAHRAVTLADEVSRHAWDMVASDLAAGNRLLQAGLDGALANVAINLPDLRGDDAARIDAAYRKLMNRR
jgi:formiminotetrahydrofolate cyclodeaminase